MAKLKLFAGIREAAGVRDAEIDAETVEQLLLAAAELYGADFSDQLERATVAINGVEVAKDRLAKMPVGPQDEVALLPPVSGGHTLGT